MKNNIMIPSLSRQKGDPSICGEFCVSNCVRRIDPVQASLKARDSGASRHKIYDMIKAMMPYKTKESWKQTIDDNQINSDNFTFGSMFNHISRGKEHSFVDIMETIRDSEMHKNIINAAAGKEDAHKDILNTISYLCGMIVAMEIDGLHSSEGTYFTMCQQV